jgi:transposase
MLALWLAVTAALAFQAAQLRSEVGYAAYFGPHDAAVERLESFFSEFDSGLHVLVAFSCPGERVCTSFREGAALELLGRLQVEIDALPNVLRTRSLLNTPIVTGPLETHTIGRRLEDRYALASDWEPLIARSAGEPFLAELVISKDERTAGVVVELQSLDSDRVREFVHRLLELVPRFEQVLGGEVFVAGDPVWTVLSDDDLDADSRNLTLLMFAVITALLWVFFRTAQLRARSGRVDDGAQALVRGAAGGAAHGADAAARAGGDGDGASGRAERGAVRGLAAGLPRRRPRRRAGGGTAARARVIVGSTRSLRVFAYPEPADLRRGFDGLSGLVLESLRRDPLSGDCFLFTNRSRTRAKVLVYDGTGLCLYHKRLEVGRFACLWPPTGAATLELTLSELALYLEGSRAVGRVALSPPKIVPRGVEIINN